MSANKIKINKVTITIQEDIDPVDSNIQEDVDLAKQLSRPRVLEVKSYNITYVPKSKTGIAEFTINGECYHKDEKSSNENGYLAIIPIPTVRDFFQYLSDLFNEVEKTDITVSNVVMTPEFWENLKKHRLFEDSCDFGSKGGGHIGYVWGSKVWLSEAVSAEAVVYAEEEKFLKDWPAFAN